MNRAKHCYLLIELVKLTGSFPFAGINNVTGVVLNAYAGSRIGAPKVSKSAYFVLHLPPQLFGILPLRWRVTFIGASPSPEQIVTFYLEGFGT
jgi:hypothetical protein